MISIARFGHQRVANAAPYGDYKSPSVLYKGQGRHLQESKHLLDHKLTFADNLLWAYFLIRAGLTMLT